MLAIAARCSGLFESREEKYPNRIRHGTRSSANSSSIGTHQYMFIVTSVASFKSETMIYAAIIRMQNGKEAAITLYLNCRNVCQKVFSTAWRHVRVC
jgi:hypothetical protein